MATTCENEEEILEAARQDENLAGCDTLDALHERLKELSDALVESDGPQSPFAQIAFEGTHPNPEYVPNAFKASKGVDGKPITAYYRYAVKSPEIAVKATVRPRIASGSFSSQRSFDDGDDRRRSSDTARLAFMEGVVSGSIGPLIERIAADDSELLGVDFSKQAVFQMKPDEKMDELCNALESNNTVRTLILRECGLGDTAVARLGSFLSTNSNIQYLDLGSNPLKEDGAIALANGLASNASVQQVDLMNMPHLGKSERVLSAFVSMYETNLTLKKIVWRLDHPLANTLARLMTRNNSIDRRKSQGKSFDDLLPDALRDVSSPQIDQLNAADDDDL